MRSRLRKVVITLLGVLAGVFCIRPAAPEERETAFEPVKIPDWVYGMTRMTFITPGDIDRAALSGAQGVHFNLVWPYYPLRRDGGGLSVADDEALRTFVTNCHKKGLRAMLGLPPFPSVALVKAHPDWRICPDSMGESLKRSPQENDLGSRIGCNNGPWGDYLIDLLAELTRDYGLDGFSFDGNYHPPICYCPACKAAYQKDRSKALPPRIDLEDIAYREYLDWRGGRLEDHYRRMQARIKAVNPNAVLMSWTTNAGRYGHLLTSPRVMTTRTNLLFDLPMQEWWLDETNLGGSVAPAFGAAYLRGLTGDRPNASEPYMMSRGNPYGTHSFPLHERLARAMLALTWGSASAESLGWPGHATTATDVFHAVKAREPWTTRTRRMPWAALLVSEQTRQFYAYRNIPEIFLPPVYGAFRAALETHLPLDLINDWDVTEQKLARYRVVVLANAAALSNAQIEALHSYVRGGGSLVCTGDTSRFDELGRTRPDFALADLFGVHYTGQIQASAARQTLDANFAISLPLDYWQKRVGVAMLRLGTHPLLSDKRLRELVPENTVLFKGPLSIVSEPKDAKEVIVRMTPETTQSMDYQKDIPAVIARPYGKGRVVYCAAGLDSALWSYAFPYQRRLLVSAISWSAGESSPITVDAPMCVQSAFYEQGGEGKEAGRFIIHLYNGLDTTADHGMPGMDVPLREESLPIHGIRLWFRDLSIKRVHLEPGGKTLPIQRDQHSITVALPPLRLHFMVVAERKK